MNRKLLLVLELVMFFNIAFAQEVDILHPKRDVRAVWLTYMDVSTSSGKLKRTVQKLSENGVNTINFHIRAFSDAHYRSNIDPWATQLNQADPGFDPLQVMIDEAHKHGLELHAWINPLRSHTSSRLATASTQENRHVSETNPDWIMSSTGIDLFVVNPGIPEARDYVIDVIEDVISRYDVDGIVFDDYFYPYPKDGKFFMKLSTDQVAYDNDPRGIANRAYWRRDNTRLLIQQTYDAIKENNQSQNKQIVFGISPFGIYKRGIHGISNSSTLDCYNDIYIDPIKWLEDGYSDGSNKAIVDYLSPQLYWSHDSGQQYDILTDWWDNELGESNRYHYSSIFTVQGEKLSVPETETEKQIKENRFAKNENTFGQIMYDSNDIITAVGTLSDLLFSDVYKYPSVPPAMPWINDIVPNPVTNLNLSSTTLSWSAPDATTEGISADKYLIYAFDDASDASANINNGTKIIGLTGETSFEVDDAYTNKYIMVSALGGCNMESNLVKVEGSLGEENFTLVNAIYPNPVSGNGLTIAFNHSGVNIDIVSVEGRKVYSGVSNSETFTVDTYDWKKGVYFVVVSSDYNKQVIKVVKK